MKQKVGFFIDTSQTSGGAFSEVVYMLKNPDIRKKQLEDCNQTLKGIRSKTSSSSEVASILSNSLIS